MLSRLKNASPKWRLFFGLWIGLELLSLPAAAGFAFSFQRDGDLPVIVEPLQTDQPGVSQFLVTHFTSLDIAVAHDDADIHVKVEDALTEAVLSTDCVRTVGGSARVVTTVPAPSDAATSAGAVFVTVTHSGTKTPDVLIDAGLDYADALPCQAMLALN